MRNTTLEMQNTALGGQKRWNIGRILQVLIFFLTVFKRYWSNIEHIDEDSETNISTISNKHLVNAIFPAITKFHQEELIPLGISSVKRTLKFINAVAILIFFMAALFIFLLSNAFYQGAPETCVIKTKKNTQKALFTFSVCYQKPFERSSLVLSWSEVPSPGKPICSALTGSYFPPLKMHFTRSSGLRLGMKGKVKV